jgi:hypothetical protein
LLASFLKWNPVIVTGFLKKTDTLFTDPGLRSMTSFMVMPGAVSMVSSKGKALCLRELPEEER